MSHDDRMVPKIHPLDREVEAEDPMELVATAVEGGDPDFMLQCIIDEFAWMGCTTEDLLALFQSPMYPVLNQLHEHFGRERVRDLIEARLLEFGRFRVTEMVAEEVEEDQEESGLIQLSLDRVRRDNHFNGVI